MPEKKLLPRRIRVLGSVAAAVVLVGLQLAGAGTANAREKVIKYGVNSRNIPIAAYGSLEGAKAEVRDDIDDQCKRINPGARATNFTYRPGSAFVSGSGNCVI